MTNVLAVFDLDGTLIDSVPDLTNALNLVLHERGFSPPLTQDEVKPMVGDGVPSLVARAFAARGGGPEIAAQVLPHYIQVYETNATNFSRPYDGVAETLKQLRQAGCHLAVCTNKLQQASITVLRGFKLDGYFDAVAGGDRYAVKKPDPEHLLGVIREAGGAPGHSVMIGDSENDAAVAHAAGVKLIMLSYGYAKADLATFGADAVLDRFDEIPAALERLGLIASA